MRKSIPAKTRLEATLYYMGTFLDDTIIKIENTIGKECKIKKSCEGNFFKG